MIARFEKVNNFGSEWLCLRSGCICNHSKYVSSALFLLDLPLITHLDFQSNVFPFCTQLSLTRDAMWGDWSLELFALTDLNFGPTSFRRLPEVTLHDFPALKTLRGGEHCLLDVHTLTLEQLPEFTSILAGYYAMAHIETLELASLEWQESWRF